MPSGVPFSPSESLTASGQTIVFSFYDLDLRHAKSAMCLLSARSSSSHAQLFTAAASFPLFLLFLLYLSRRYDDV
ncbi:uncharacterized protein STEHIDRAFT_117161 [Stereum hirsutum FP-91666 SS1]|uniref:uncharacterized protein n=1 Tax=Stereum hirsutum (strain FP-91666) TaxID=721885 RepID=UPI000440CA49|nr:uncharacterized protein STEHIDRAFT_117161 [Stereum hirsutum FP-91666 SS1]EIM92071.1 hypothetical protein STEHIDRAFT_117161 [Stereum hirsutum FP-91666 SS1]